MPAQVLRQHEVSLIRRPLRRIEGSLGRETTEIGQPEVFKGAVIPSSGLFWEQMSVGQLQAGDQFLFMRRRQAVHLSLRDLVFVGAQVVNGNVVGGDVYQVTRLMPWNKARLAWGYRLIGILSSPGEDVPEEVRVPAP